MDLVLAPKLALKDVAPADAKQSQDRLRVTRQLLARAIERVEEVTRVAIREICC